MDPVHRDIKLIITEQYQCHPYLKALDTEMALILVEFVSALVCWVDYTYEYLISGGNAKEYMLWITTRVTRSIFEDYLDPNRDTSIRTYFGSDPHRRSTLVWVMILCHLYQEKIKYHPIVVGAYTQWLVSNSGRNEALDAKILVVKVKDRVDELSAMFSSTTKRTSKLKKTVASYKKAADQTASKVRSLKK